MATRALFLLLFSVCSCDSQVVDAVREPTPAPSITPVPLPTPTPLSPLEISLIHRYSFDGEGTEVLDSKGAAHGQLQGTTLADTGQLSLEGERTGQYVNLPNGIVSGLGDATFEAWLTWNGGDPWQRVFDFGSTAGGEDSPAATGGTSYLFLATLSSPDPERMLPTPSLRLGYSQNGLADEDVCSADPFPTGVPTHVAVVIERVAQRMAIYQDGVSVAECFLGRPLSAIKDVNNWLGRSNYRADADLSGIYDEFRIYGAALTASEIADSFLAGPNAGR